MSIFSQKKPQLVGLSGPVKGKKYRLINDSITIGSAPSADITLPGSKVSDLHATVESDGKGQWIVRNKSSFGILINGTKEDFKTLSPGDTLQIGELVLLRFDAKAGHKKKEEPKKERKLQVIGLLQRPGILAGVVIYILIIVGVAYYLSQDDSDGQNISTLSREYVDEAIIATRSYLNEQTESGLRDQTIKIDPNSDEAAYYYTLFSTQDEVAKREAMEAIVSSASKAFFNAWRYENQVHYHAALREYIKITRLVPDSRAPITIVANWRISVIQEEMFNE